MVDEPRNVASVQRVDKLVLTQAHEVEMRLPLVVHVVEPRFELLGAYHFANVLDDERATNNE